MKQFYINFSRQEHQIDVLYVSINPEILRFNPIPPFIFPLIDKIILHSKKSKKINLQLKYDIFVWNNMILKDSTTEEI